MNQEVGKSHFEVHVKNKIRTVSISDGFTVGDLKEILMNMHWRETVDVKSMCLVKQDRYSSYSEVLDDNSKIGSLNTEDYTRLKLEQVDERQLWVCKINKK